MRPIKVGRYLETSLLDNAPNCLVGSLSKRELVYSRENWKITISSMYISDYIKFNAQIPTKNSFGIGRWFVEFKLWYSRFAQSETQNVYFWIDLIYSCHCISKSIGMWIFDDTFLIPEIFSWCALSFFILSDSSTVYICTSIIIDHFFFLQITKLKIDSNPFAKGFRDSSRLTDAERLILLHFTIIYKYNTV